MLCEASRAHPLPTKPEALYQHTHKNKDTWSILKGFYHHFRGRNKQTKAIQRSYAFTSLALT